MNIFSRIMPSWDDPLEKVENAVVDTLRTKKFDAHATNQNDACPALLTSGKPLNFTKN